MPNTPGLTAAEIEKYDRIYREGGLRAMGSPQIHYERAGCPHGCGCPMRWIDFNLERFPDPIDVYLRLTAAFWNGSGFAGRCPRCGGWIRFKTLGMDAIDEDEAALSAVLPDNWAEIAQFA